MITLYFSTTLDLLADSPPDEPPAILHAGKPYYRLTPETYSWVIGRVEHAQQMLHARKLSAETYDEILTKLAALIHKATETGEPLPPDEPQRRPLARLPVAPKPETTPALPKPRQTALGFAGEVLGGNYGEGF